MSNDDGQGKVLEAELLRLASSCYQCGRCTGGCPTAFAMDHSPRRMLRLLQLGLVEDALRSDTPWLCANCHGCSFCCPRGVDLTDLMYRLRQLAIARGVANQSVWFYREFMDNLLKRGIVYEPELMIAYARRVGLGALTAHLQMGLEMARKGKLLFKPRVATGSVALKQIVGKVLKDREPGV